MLVARRTLDPRTEPAAALLTAEREPGDPPLRAYLVTPVLAVGALAVTLLFGSQYGIGLRDPDGVIGSRLVLVLALVALLWALDVIPRGIRLSRATSRPAFACIRAVAAERWSVRRALTVLGLIVAFYVIYLCYRNVKSYIPLARPGLFDGSLLELEESFFGAHPAELLHTVLGTGITAHALSVVYLLFLTFVPLSVAAALVWRTDMAGGLWWLAVISLNWVLGAASYFVLPSLGPAFSAPWLFADLPYSGVTALQDVLVEHRQEFVAAPVASGGLQSIAAFASLHVSIVLSGAIVAHLLRAPRALRVGMWVFFGLTVIATIYFGWHYVVDDIAGVAIALVAVYLGAMLTGWRLAPSPSRAQVTAKAT